MDQPAYQISIPLLNPNEPDAKVVSLEISEGQFVERNTVLCTLETTKSTAEILAEVDGYVKGLQISENDMVHAGSLLCYLAENQDWQPEVIENLVDAETGRSTVQGKRLPPGLRISQPALRLAEKTGLDLTKLPVGPLVTEKMIRELDERSAEIILPEIENKSQEIIIYGGGGHGKSIIELIRSQSIFHIHGIVDDGLKIGEQVLDVPVVGGSEVLPALHSQGIRQAVNAVGGIGDISSRINVFKEIIQNGFNCPTIIHGSAVVEVSAEIYSGVQVFPQAYIGSSVKIGFGVIVNTGAVISHDCSLDDFVNISPGALLAGGVTIGRGSLVGMGVTLNLGVRVGENARIGNGATVKADVPDGGLVRAGMIWPA